MLRRKDIICVYESTGSVRAVARELGISRRTARAYVNEYIAARNAGDDVLVAYLKKTLDGKKVTAIIYSNNLDIYSQNRKVAHHEMAHSHDLTQEDISICQPTLDDYGVRPSLDAFRQYMQHEPEPAKPEQETVSAAEIEECAMNGLKAAAELMNNNKCTQRHATT